MGTYTNNNDRRWMINVFNKPGSGLKMTCIICGDIPYSLKVMSKKVVFSGELKDACGIVDNNEEFKFFHYTLIYPLRKVCYKILFPIIIIPKLLRQIAVKLLNTHHST